MTLGSLFDGIGGFPLSGAMHGITPVWASEIEPFPILVTEKRFPQMKHLGSVTDIDGAKIETVDIITFGSPCQDLSVAGLKKGIHDGERSNLFFEAVRIIKEMRANDRAAGRTGKHVRCRWAVWENVPGAQSSQKGADFRAVLQALCEVADPDVSVPMPEKGKWSKAGCIVGDGYSVAWRTLDAQYYPRTPQRRKRIYLVADFASERAGEILFESEGVCGHPAQSGEAREGSADDAPGSAGGGCIGLTNRGFPCEGPVETLRAGSHGAIPMVAAFMGGQGPKAGAIAYDESISPTLRATASGSNQTPDVVYPAVARTLTAEHDASPCVDRGQNTVCYGICSLNYINPVVYSSSSFGTMSEGVGCLGTGTRATAEMVAVYPERTGALCANSHPGSYTGQDAYNDMLPVIPSDKPPRKYIVRRLTPLECCRLQGYPDGWTENVGFFAPTKEQVDFFADVWAKWAEINGTKPKSRNAVFKWLQAPSSDSAEYKAYGNSLAIPCSSDVLGRIARLAKRDA